MKISAINPFNNYKSQTRKVSLQRVDLKIDSHKDTVSFKSSDFIKEGLEEIDKVIKDSIVPFMEDSKTLYQEVAKIGFNAQESLNTYQDLETDLMMYKLDLLEDIKNPVFLKAEKYLNTAKIYENNLLTFDRLNEMSNQEYYNTPQIKNEIEDLKIMVCQPNRELKVLKDFASSYKDNNALLDSLLENVTLNNENPVVQKRMKKTQKRFMGALYYMTVAPYSEAKKLIEEKSVLEKDSENRPRDIYALLKRMDNLQQKAQKLSESVDFYYENKNKMSDFAKNAKDNEPSPSPDELKRIYSILKTKCKEAAESNRADYEQDFSENFEQKLSAIDFNKVEKDLTLQKEKADKVISEIEAIKQQIIDKNNEDYMRDHGLLD